MNKATKKINLKRMAKKVMPYAIALAIVVVGCVLSVSGYGCDLWTKGETTAKDLYTNVRNLSTYIAGALFVISLLFALFCKDQRKVDAALDWTKKIFIIYLVILGAGWIFEWGRSLMSDAPTIFGGGGGGI